MVDYEGAIKRPVQDIKKLLIGSVISIIPVITFLASGYAVKTAKNTMNGNNDLPEWENWGNLFIVGLVVMVIGFIYSIPGTILILVGAGSILMGLIGGNAGLVDMSSVLAGGGVITLVGGLFLLVAMFLLPMAIMRYVDKNDISAAFGFGDVLRKAFTGRYIVALIIVCIYTFLVVGLLSFIPVVGTVIGLFAATITSMTVFAEVYKEGMQ